ncbi:MULTISPECIES: hypothetical protein [Roseomonadaceae]|uniref:Lipoprotein n=1 Tax=Falsiroseomonas oleicola TaxID=2801474 RepID=A0ABS6HCH8_9PROT|nr:hypothetical protein [Roseomonas oleicola]MBU8546051.1 hypothetical protein [Roseomonas oleicola]
MRRTLPLAGLVLALGLAACAGGGAGTATRGDRGSARPSLEQAAARLPEEVAAFGRGETIWHERDRPGLGVAVDYAGPGRSAVATVSLYDRGEPMVPQDITSAIIQQEIARAVQDALALADRRTSQDITEGARSTLPVPGQAPLQCVDLRGTYGRQPVQTLICLGAASGRFLKVQVTTPQRQVRPADPLPFVVGIAQAARG